MTSRFAFSWTLLITLARKIGLAIGTGALLTAGLAPAQDRSADSTPVDFVRDVLPILQSKCIECHNESLQMAELRLDSRQAMIDGGVLEPGDAESSLMVQRLHDRDLGVVMPPTGRLSASEIAKLKAWVASGGNWPDEAKLDATHHTSGADPTTAALRGVVRSDDLDALRRLLRDPSLVHRTDQRGATPLMHAAMYASVECLELLLEKGADVDAVDQDGMTALMFAVGDAAKVRRLLDRGAKVDALSKLGRTALLLASAQAGNSETAGALLNAGADVHYADRRGWTAVVLAARTGDTDLLKTLLDAGGEVNGGDATRLSPGTPLMQAAWASDVAAAELLLARGAATNTRSLNTALIFAATHGSDELVNLLLDAGADPNASVVTNYVPESPILAAAYSDALNETVMQTLLDRRVDVRKEDKRGESPLSMAEQRGPTRIADLLRQAVGDSQNGESEDSKTEPAADDNTQRSAGEVAEKSLRLLQSCDLPFFAKSGCVACHQQTASSLVANMAKAKGFEIDEQVWRQQVKLTAVDLDRKRVGFLQRMKVGGSAHRIAYLLWGLAAADYPPDEITDAACVELAGLQLRNGRWVSDAHRPPTEYSSVTATAVSLRALQHFSPPGWKDAGAARTRRATDWLASANVTANSEKAFRLLGLRWGGAEPSIISRAADDLLSDQSENGGWSQLPQMETDAYATGLTLYALHQGGGLEVSEAAYRNGVQYLLATCRDDGSWHVRSRSFAIQPYFESGFPHGHDQWISSAATGWASMALMQTLPDAATDAD